MKTPFKKSSIVDTVVNIGLGGAANAAMDYVVESVPTLQSLGETTTNIIKIGVGAVAGSMLTNKYARAAADGLAVVGASDLIKGYIQGATTPNPAPNPGGNGTGRVAFMGNPGIKYRGFKKGAGMVGTVPFMG